MIVLAGPPGTGKSTVAERTAERLGGTAEDLDRLIERKMKQTVGEIIRESGEQAFRRIEVDALLDVPVDTPVLALGGGTLTTHEGRVQARRLGPVAGLVASPAVLTARLDDDQTDRPLLSDVGALVDTRRETYAAVDFNIDADQTPDRIADDVVTRAATVRTLDVRVGADHTRVLVGRDLHAALRGAVATNQPSRTVVAIVDAGVPTHAVNGLLAGVRGMYPLTQIDVVGGEAVKTWRSLETTIEAALEAGAGRQSVVIGIGGGATTDLAGMVASMLGRGAPLVLVPTTVLAQADAAVGGKCAINTAAGRNLVGAFHPATDVIVDLDLLETLDAAEHRAGLAEILKGAIIGDAELFAHVVDGTFDVDVVARAIALKARVVLEDPFESGVRKHLNLGHTLAHALESASDHSIRHGEAVAIGIAAAARYGAERGWTPRSVVETIVDGLTAVGLPTYAESAVLGRASAWIAHDKKGSRTHIDLIAVHGLEDVRIHAVPLTEVRRALIHHGGRP